MSFGWKHIYAALRAIALLCAMMGTVSGLAQADLGDLLDRQSAFYEGRLLPKPPWSPAKMTPDALERMKRMIVPCRMRVDDIQGTWKLNQNKPDSARAAAAEHVEADGFGIEVRELAALMRET